MTIQDSRTLPAYCERPRGRLDLALTQVKNLCLDAPLVAIVWQDCMARAWDAPIQPIHRILLALVAWLAYMGDRLLDGPKQGRTGEGSERHCFAWNHRRALLATWTVVAGIGAMLAIGELEKSDLILGLTAMLGLALYAFAARSWPRIFRGLLPRELLVGIFFSVACTLFIFSTLGRLPAPAVLTGMAFALLCSLDCWAISCTDRDRDLAHGEWNLVTTYAWAWPAYSWVTLVASGLTLAASLFLPPGTALVWRAIALSCLLLFFLIHSAGPSRRLALYADLALLTPLCFLLLT